MSSRPLALALALVLVLAVCACSLVLGVSARARLRRVVVDEVFPARADVLDESYYVSPVPNAETTPSKWVELQADPLLRVSHLRATHVRLGQAFGQRDHPHYGYEQVLYVKEGTLLHGDAMRLEGALHAGDLQWLKANSGVEHMHKIGRLDSEGEVELIELWINGPEKDRDRLVPHYQDIGAQNIPVHVGAGYTARVLAGSAYGLTGPASPARPTLLIDYELLAGAVTIDFAALVPDGLVPFLFVYRGSVRVQQRLVDTTQLALLSDGEELLIEPVGEGDVTKLLLFAGSPVGETLAKNRYMFGNSWQSVSAQVARIKGQDMQRHAARMERSTRPSTVLVFNDTKISEVEARKTEDERRAKEHERKLKAQTEQPKEL